MRMFRIFTIGVGLVLFSATLASAQATRTWVSGVGDDTLPCSRTAPCKTFAGAISKTAPFGEISVLDPGGFGGVTITKPITINGEGTNGHILASFTNAVIVNVTTAAAFPNGGPVTLKNLQINGANTGLDAIRFIAGTTLNVENVWMTGFTQQGIEVQLPTLPATGAGRKLHVKNTTITHMAQGGIILDGIVQATLDNVTIERSGANGLRANNNTEVTIRNSNISGNAQNGITAVSADLATPSTITIEGSVLSANVNGGLRASGVGALIRIGDSLVTENATGLTSAGNGVIESFGDNRVSGNGANGTPTITTPRI